MSKLCGVYAIRCKLDGKIYVGSSKDIHLRWRVHLRTLNNGTHINRHLSSAFKKYGEGSFSFEVLELCSIEELIRTEQKHMDIHLAYERNFGYNNARLADRPTGFRHSEEAKKVMSEKKMAGILEGRIKSNLKRRNGPHSEKTIEKIRLGKIGENNPMYGRVEAEDKKMARMKNMLSKPRWNAGLTKHDSPILMEMSKNKQGLIPLNRVRVALVDTQTLDCWICDSMTELSKISPLSLVSIVRLKGGRASASMTKKYNLSW